MTTSKKTRGFALIEILLAIAILSIVLLSVFSGVSTSINVLSGSKNHTKAMIIARSMLNEFILKRQRGTDLSKMPLEDYPGYFLSRVSERFEHDLLGPIPAKKTKIIISWNDKGKERNYSITYIYPSR